MKIQSFSVVVGGKACNAKCPFCVSRMTPDNGVCGKASIPNWRNFDIGCRYAMQSGVSTVLLTGKGEPTLHPELVTEFLNAIAEHGFPFVELQTNGLELHKPEFDMHLRDWYDRGLTTIAISVCHYEDERNREIYTPHRAEYPSLTALIEKLHGFGFSVRLSAMFVKGYIDDIKSFCALVDFAEKNGVEQLTVRNISAPSTRGEDWDHEVFRYVEQNRVPNELIDDLRMLLDDEGIRLMELAHGAIVYDYLDQNVCLTNCLTIDPTESNDLRQLIFFPDGHLRYDWQYRGAILI